ncbi:phosphopantetheine-binding protein, partial [Halomonas elongata]|uniref:phosphopantetheine-binding protein n=1 Tax=Halomonas elongata TaxID=2746 RepID=UPI0038D36B25
VVPLAALPLSPNGKVDRQALPEPDVENRQAYEAPQGEVEAGLAAIWAEVLGVERISRHDNFFELGGHSLAVPQVQARVQDCFGVRIPLSRYFNHATLAALSDVIQSWMAEAAEDEEAQLEGMAILLDGLEN